MNIEIQKFYGKTFVNVKNIMNIFDYDFDDKSFQSIPYVHYEGQVYIEIETFFYIFYNAFTNVEVDFFSSTILTRVKYLDKTIIKRLSNVKAQYTITDSIVEGYICITFKYN